MWSPRSSVASRTPAVSSAFWPPLARARTLGLLGGEEATGLHAQMAQDTLGAVVKERDDLDVVRDNLEEITSGA